MSIRKYEVTYQSDSRGTIEVETFESEGAQYGDTYLQFMTTDFQQRKDFMVFSVPHTRVVSFKEVKLESET